MRLEIVFCVNLMDYILLPLRYEHSKKTRWLYRATYGLYS